SAVGVSESAEGQDVVYIWSGGLPLEPKSPLDEDKERAQKSVIATAAAYYDNFESFEIARKTTISQDFAASYNLTRGCPLHVDFSLSRSGPLRPAWGVGGYRTPVAGLYLSGAGTHPGGGVSGYPGKNAAQ